MVHLTAKQQAALDVITNATDPIASTDLASALGISRVAAYKVIASLETKRLVMATGHRHPPGKGRPAVLFTASVPF